MHIISIRKGQLLMGLRKLTFTEEKKSRFILFIIQENKFYKEKTKVKGK